MGDVQKKKEDAVKKSLVVFLFVVLFVCLATFPMVTSASVLWNPTNSTHNGKYFVTNGMPQPGYGYCTNDDGSINTYGVGMDIENGYSFNFVTNVSGTNTEYCILNGLISVGTNVSLEFTKDAGTPIYSIAIAGADASTLTYTNISSTKFVIRCNLASNAPSYRFQAPGSFGLIVFTNGNYNYSNTIFVANMFHRNIEAPNPSDTPPQSIAIRANGSNGVSVAFAAFVPESFATNEFGPNYTNVTAWSAELDTTVSLPLSGTNLTTGFDFGSGEARVLCLVTSNSLWSQHNVNYVTRPSSTLIPPLTLLLLSSNNATAVNPGCAK